MKDPEFTKEEWEQFKRELKAYIDYMIAYPQEIMARYPRYRELQRELAEAFLIEMVQEENPSVRQMIESGQMKRAKAFVDTAWDAEAYDRWKREEDVRVGIAKSMMDELIPPNFMEMSKQERDKYFEENWDRIDRVLERLRRKRRYAGP